MSTCPKPIYFTPEELELIADALRDVRGRQFSEMIRGDIPESEKAMAFRKFTYAETALAKVRAA